jgi:hypothetical protein
LGWYRKVGVKGGKQKREGIEGDEGGLRVGNGQLMVAVRGNTGGSRIVKRVWVNKGESGWWQ